ncbi:MAG: kinase/pyrophosphorylase [Planctomycetes bacterium]|nr:kinase/pyrophosphorylase [Planctomycetota bacterium]
MAQRDSLPIVILSGGAGRTGEEIVKAALAQFDQPAVELIRRPHIRSAQAAQQAIVDAQRKGAVVLHTLVAPETRDAATVEAERRMVPLVDLLGPALAVLEDYLGVAPRRQAGLSYVAQKDRFDRMDAVDYTLSHDDGQRPEGLPLADVVLVGPSRVSKSVTCFYLAYRGVRAANVPLIPGHEPPPQLREIEPHKVIALVMNPHRLRSIREVRATHFAHEEQDALDAYADPKQIAQDLRLTHALAEERDWRRVDVSYKSVEETAEEITRMIEDTSG